MKIYNYTKNSSIKQLSVRPSNLRINFSLSGGRFNDLKRISNFFPGTNLSGSYLIYFRFNQGPWTDIGRFSVRKFENKPGVKAEWIDIDIIPRDRGVEFVSVYNVRESGIFNGSILGWFARDEAADFPHIEVEVRVVMFDLH